MTLQLRSVDRLFLQAYVPGLMSEGLLIRFLLDRGFPIPSPVLLGRIGAGYVRPIERFASRNQVPVVRFEKGQPKEEVVRPYFEQAEREGRFCVVLIGVAQERAREWARWCRGGSEGHPHFAFGWQSRVPNHSFYVREWGRAFVKCCCYAPGRRALRPAEARQAQDDDPRPGIRAASDLVKRDFNPQAPNRLWCAGIKEIPTREGTLYLASVLDCFSRRAVGWSMRDDMRRARRRRPRDGRRAARPDDGLVHHSDHDSGSTRPLVFGQRCEAAGIARSTGSKGDCFDNAAIESYHASLEKDLLRRNSFHTKQEARTAVFEYVEVFYNRERLHSALGYRSPDEFENHHLSSKNKTTGGLLTVPCPPNRGRRPLRVHAGALTQLLPVR